MGTTIPETERVVRPLTPLLPDADAIREAWQEAVEDAGGTAVTAAGVRRVVQRRLEPERPTVPNSCTIDDLNSLVSRGVKFGTIYADPPWDYSNKGTRAAANKHYDTEGIGWLENLPIEQLAATQSHLHLWTTNAFLGEAIDLIAAWGFEYKSCFVWCKPTMGIGNYWRVSHEFMLLGVRGGLVFTDHSQMSWASYPRQKHSAKPDQVRKSVEDVSPEPRLELFARAACEGWVSWGNEIERDVFTLDVEHIAS